MTIKPEDIPLAAIEAFHEAHPLACTEVYDWTDAMVERVKRGIAAAMNAMPSTAPVCVRCGDGITAHDPGTCGNCHAVDEMPGSPPVVPVAWATTYECPPTTTIRRLFNMSPRQRDYIMAHAKKVVELLPGRVLKDDPPTVGRNLK